MPDEHKAWMTLETDAREPALRIISQGFRANVRVDKWDLSQIESMRAEHDA